MSNSPMSSINLVKVAYQLLLGREIDPTGLASWTSVINEGSFTREKLVKNLCQSDEFTIADRSESPFLRLHKSRQEWIKSVPKANKILDIGGSSPSRPEGALIELGYQHKPSELIIFDKPPTEQYWGKPVYSQQYLSTFDWGKVEYIHSYAEEIKNCTYIANAKFDMIFMGQCVEHIHPEKLTSVLEYISRHLNDDGIFVMDTPNRLVTQFQTGPNSYIDPDHKKEYEPSVLRDIIESHGLEMVSQCGMLDCEQVIKNKSFRLLDLYDHDLICDNPDNGYLFAMHFKKSTKRPKKNSKAKQS